MDARGSPEEGASWGLPYLTMGTGQARQSLPRSGLT